MRILCSLLLIGTLCFAEVKLGQPLKLKKDTPLETILASPDKFVGKTVQVKGKVSSVCQSMGCWMVLTDAQSGKTVRIKVEDGVIVFPKDSVGKTAIAEGKFVKSVNATGDGKATYQIAGKGAVVLD